MISIGQLATPSKYTKLVSSLGSFSSLNSRLIHSSSPSLVRINRSDNLSKTFLCQSLKTENNLLKLHSVQNLNNVIKGYSTGTTDKDPLRKPTLEKLLIVEEKMKLHLPKFLKETHPIGFYTPDVVFENLYWERPKITIGLTQYVFELVKIRWKINVKFSNAVIQLLKVTHDEEEGTVKIRWRMRGLRGMKIFTPWKIKIWNLKDSVNTEAEWHDGFSILYIRGDGRIWKHTLQRVIANKDETERDKNKLLDKLAKVKNINVG